MSFYDRTDAGHRLAAELETFKGEDVVVFALPRGGAPVAEPIAVLLKARSRSRARQENWRALPAGAGDGRRRGWRRAGRRAQ